MFIGRKEELAILEELYHSKKSELVVIYGRRRIGKSSLIQHFANGKQLFFFEALEGENTFSQLKHFQQVLASQFKDPLLDSVQFRTWHDALTYLSERVFLAQDKKHIVCFDEIQWMAAGRKALISTIKYFWDNHWKQKNVMLILCGSIASYIIKNVLRSQALYGRISSELQLKSLLPNEASLFFRGKRSHRSSALL